MTKAKNKRDKLRIRTGTRAGGTFLQHGVRIRRSRRAKLRVRTGTCAGGIHFNHGVQVLLSTGARG